MAVASFSPVSSPADLASLFVSLFLCVCAAQGTSGGVKRDISSSLTRGINAKRLCNRLKSKDGQMCELKYEQKIDPKTADFGKMRVKELRKICDDEGLDTKGLVEKDEYIKKIKKHFGLKEEM